MSYKIEMVNITKYFPGVVANHDVNLNVREGEVHSLLGENGAGKSTLMNILCGLYRPTSGEIYIDGIPRKMKSAKEAIAMGIGMVHQHFMLIPRLTVVENCLIGMTTDNPMKLPTSQTKEKIEKLASQYDFDIDTDARIEELSVGERQRVEIIKTLLRDSKILILDEPTAVLTPQETDALFKTIRSLTRDGYTVIYISHKLKEVMEISNKVTVLRQGRVVAENEICDCSVAYLAHKMVGRDVVFPPQNANHRISDTVLEVKNLSYMAENEKMRSLENLSFYLRAGEILGIAGVDGNGQTELADCLTGLKNEAEGEALFEGENLIKCSARDVMKMGISYIPQDRQESGLVLNMNLTENTFFRDYYREAYKKCLFLDWKRARTYCEQLVEDYKIKTPGVFELARNLSGGNQQKLIVAREVARSPKLLIAVHPTRGLDVGAIEYIHSEFVKQRDKGTAILLISTELEEIMRLSDRVCVLFEGKIMGTFVPGQESIENVGLMMGGTEQKDISSSCILPD